MTGWKRSSTAKGQSFGVCLSEILAFTYERAVEVTDQEREHFRPVWVLWPQRHEKGEEVKEGRDCFIFEALHPSWSCWWHLDLPEQGSIRTDWRHVRCERHGRKVGCCKLRKYEKIALVDERSLDGKEVLFLINQFPAECTGEFKYHLVNELVRVQNVAMWTLKHEVEKVSSNHAFFCVWPEHVWIGSSVDTCIRTWCLSCLFWYKLNIDC